MMGNQNDRSYSPLWKAIRSKMTNADLRTFRSPGGPNSRLAHWEPNEKSLRWFKSYLQLAAGAIGGEQLSDLTALGKVDLGEPVTVTVFREDLQKTVSVNLDYMYAVEEVHFLRRNLDAFSQVENIVEVGAGFGRTAHALLRLNPAIKRYEIVDLPETLSLSSAYLSQVLPRDDFGKLQFVDATRQISGHCEYDLFIQIDGFQEMEGPIISAYYSEIISASTAAYLCNPIGKYAREVAGVEGLDEDGYKAARKLGRSTLEIDPWSEVSLSAARQIHDEAYRPPDFKLVQSTPSFLRPFYSHGLYLLEHSGSTEHN